MGSSYGYIRPLARRAHCNLFFSSGGARNSGATDPKIFWFSQRVEPRRYRRKYFWSCKTIPERFTCYFAPEFSASVSGVFQAVLARRWELFWSVLSGEVIKSGFCGLNERCSCPWLHAGVSLPAVVICSRAYGLLVADGRAVEEEWWLSEPETF